MSFLISYQSLEKSYDDRVLFSNLSMGFSEGERIGLVGANGSGKSTLLKIFAGEETPDDGVRHMKKNVRLAYLPQIDNLDPDLTIEEVLSKSLEKEGEEEHTLYKRVQKMLGVGEFQDYRQKVSVLSGGLRKRLAICSVFIKDPDIMFIDEPTNHLDIEGILWLEKLLKSASFSYVLVSHDRYFLENITTKIIELGKCFPEGYFKVEGAYQSFLTKKSAFLESQKNRESSLANIMRQETNWLSHGPKARTTKAKYRIDKAARLKEELNDIHQRNLSSRKVNIDFDSTHRKTKKLLVARNLEISLGGKNLFKNVSIKLTPGLRLGLLGRNGTGKSTLLNILAKRTRPDEGSVETAEGLKMVVFDQHRDKLDPSQTLRRALAPLGDAVVYRDRSVHVATWAKRFLFRPDQLDMPVKNLSGGEQARILIANLMTMPADVLFLDEPTNDLDIDSIEVLEDSLMEFPGAIVLVTHDRFMLDRVTHNIIGFKGDGETGVFSDYSQWFNAFGTLKPDKKAKEKKTPAPPKKTARKKLSYKHQYELEHMEEKILEAETEVETLEAKVQDPEVINDPEQMQKYCTLLKNSQEQVEKLYTRWQELESFSDG